MNIKIAKHIESLVAYPPGKPLEELEREYGVTGSIKLASNENAWGPSPFAVSAIQDALASLHRYPDGSCYYLAAAVAERLGVLPQELVFGNGSNEIIGLLVDAFLAPGQEVIISHPTFLMYEKFVQIQGGVNTVIPLRDMCHDLPAILAAITGNTRLIFLDNPNNPTGRIIEKQDFDDFLRQVPDTVIVVLDEAYVDFVSADQRLDTLACIRGDKPVVALRTFSKAYGLSGLRLGFGLMNQQLAGYLHRVRQPFNVNSLAQAGGRAALQDEEHYQKTLVGTSTGIQWLFAELEKLGLRPFPTHTNFFLVDVGGAAGPLYEKLLHKGVIVRPMQAYGYPNFIRITVGQESENQRLMRALSSCVGELGYV